MVSPVTYSRGTPSPQPSVRSSRTQRMSRLSVSVRVCEAWRIGFPQGDADVKRRHFRYFHDNPL